MTRRPVLLDRCLDGRQVDRTDPAQVDDLGARCRRRPAPRRPRALARPSAAWPRWSRRVPSRTTSALPTSATAPRVDRTLAARRAPCARRRGPGCRSAMAARSSCRPRPGDDAVTTRSPGRCHEPALDGGQCWVPNRPVAAADDADGDRHRELAAGHEAVLGQLVDDRVAGRRQEVGEHDLDDRAHARRGTCPRATPMKPFSQIGVDRTRPGRTSRAARCWS